MGTQSLASKKSGLTAETNGQLGRGYKLSPVLENFRKKHDLKLVTLLYHLRVLEHAGLIKRKFSKGRRLDYEVTNLGREMLKIDDYTEWL